MSTATVIPPHVHRRDPWLTPRLRSAAASVAAVLLMAVRVAVSPHRSSLARLADMPLTVAGAAAIDFAAFHVAHGWGWLAVGLSLVVIEHMIADPQE